jgi:hypothetical protein
MQNTTENKWPWTEDLDALKAAPQHHKLLFENESVRVIDARISPGDMTKIHTHKWPASLYILSWSDFIRYDKDDKILLDSRSLSMEPLIGKAMWSDPLTPHALKNVGTTDLHVISVEIKQK